MISLITYRLINQKNVFLFAFSGWIATQAFFYQQYFVRVHDYLDHFFVLQKLWSTQVGLFDYTSRIKGVLDTIDANALGFSDLNPTLLLLKIMEPDLAYCISDIALRIIALWSFYFLAKKMTKPSHENWTLFGAVLFSSIDQIPSLAPTLFLTPSLILLFLQVTKNGLTISLVVLTFALWQWTGVVYGAFALIIFFCIWTLLSWRKESNQKKNLIAALSVNLISAIFATQRLFFSAFIEDFDSNRTDWVPNEITLNLIAKIPLETLAVIGFQNSYLNGINKLLVLSWFAYLVLIKRLYTQISRQEALILIGIGLLVVIVITEETLGILLRLGLPFQTNRIFTLYPLIFLLILTRLSNRVAPKKGGNKKKKLGILFFIGILILPQPYNLIRNKIIDDLSNMPKVINVAKIIYTDREFLRESENQNETLIAKMLSRKATTIQYYYRESEYKKALKLVLKDGLAMNTLSVGLDPMIASYNGFNSFDGYVFNYESEYKSRFRPIISGSLLKDNNARIYFDEWGNRVYTSFGFSKISIRHLDFCYANKIGVNYVLLGKNLEPVEQLRELGTFNSLRLMKITCN